MGNAWRCCPLGSRRTQRIHPTNHSFPESSDTGSFPRRTNRLEEESELTSCPHSSIVKENKLSEIGKGENQIKKSYGSKSEKRRVTQEDYMKQWLTTIMLQNTLLPSYVTFNNKRHLHMRSKFTEMIQKMNYSSTITENRDEEQVQIMCVQPKNTGTAHYLSISSFPGNLENRKLPQFNLGKTVGRINSRHQTHRLPVSKKKENRTSMAAFQRQCSPSPQRRVSGTDSDGGVIGETSSKYHEKICPESSGRPFQISSNWLDEDFDKEIILTDPVSPLEETEQPRTAVRTSQNIERSHKPVILLDMSDDFLQDALQSEDTNATNGPLLSTRQHSTPPHETNPDSHRVPSVFREKNCSSMANSNEKSS